MSAPKRSPSSKAARRATRPGGRSATAARPGGKPRTPTSGASTGVGGRGGRTHLTSRAAILVIVMCAIVLSLAYPVREYVIQRRQIAELREQERESRQKIAALEARKRELNDPEYIKQQARHRLHYCMPDEKCYVVVGKGEADGPGTAQASETGASPWYAKLWKSVEATDRARGSGDPGSAGDPRGRPVNP
ncbi:MAG: septum formation initiator family protein [Streptosporangiales bacterium]|nr:septum formation initiator family protein [Streptosporangiales bacterium]